MNLSSTRLLRSLILLPLILVFAACDSGSDPNSSSGRGIPGVGSLFYFSGEMISGGAITEPTRVVAGGITLKGKNTVWIFRTTFPGGDFDELISYEPNGDFSMMLTDSAWLTFPMSGAAVVVRELPAYSATRRYARITNLGETSDTINNSVVKSTRFETRFVQFQGADSLILSNVEWNWANKLGYWTFRKWAAANQLDSFVVR
jgi:hypothetical protein